jgi:amino-acid N-acetyltransferase
VQLTEAAFDLARKLRVSTLYLLTETAADFFTRCGFVPVERSAVAPAVQQSVEFHSVCPQSAQAMVLYFRREHSQ